MKVTYTVKVTLSKTKHMNVEELIDAYKESLADDQPDGVKIHSMEAVITED